MLHIAALNFLMRRHAAFPNPLAELFQVGGPELDAVGPADFVSGCHAD
jgi:hypothetical protein